MSSHTYDFDESAYNENDEEGYYNADANVVDYDGEYVGDDNDDDDDEDDEEERDIHLDMEDEIDRMADGAEREALQEELQELVEEQLENDRSGSAVRTDGGHTTINISSLVNGSPHRFATLMSFLTRTANADDDEEEVPNPYSWIRRTSRQRRPAAKAPSWWKVPHKEPQPAGVQLLLSGEFGRVGTKRKMYQRQGWVIDDDGKAMKKSKDAGDPRSDVLPNCKLDYILESRRSSTRYMPREDFMECVVPNSHGTVVASYPSNVYCGQYSTDSSFYYVCRKDYILHMYDMNAARSSEPVTTRATGHQTTLKERKSIRGYEGGWTITDSHLSPSNDRLIYSSMNSRVYMVKTLEPDETQTAIDFRDQNRRRQSGMSYYDGDNVIWSCRFSADGNEVIAGGQSTIYVYDLQANRRTVKISAHDEDVNSCCWADMGSNVLVSASDDTFLKIWDRRSLGSSQKPSGVLIGHTEGITYVSAKGDGRYLISNGKDQALRLWDLRKMRSNLDYENARRDSYGIPDFDYRYYQTGAQRIQAHPKDCSVMAYRGHTVMRTLIRCHFSPAESTGSSYIYSGSADGRIFIWSVDGRLVQVLDRMRSYPISNDPSGAEPDTESDEPTSRGKRGWSYAVRDVSWDSQQPVLMSAAWGNTKSTIARHEWKGLGKLGRKLEDWVERAIAEVKEEESRSRSDTFDSYY